MSARITRSASKAPLIAPVVASDVEDLFGSLDEDPSAVAHSLDDPSDSDEVASPDDFASDSESEEVASPVAVAPPVAPVVVAKVAVARTRAPAAPPATFGSDEDTVSLLLATLSSGASASAKLQLALTILGVKPARATRASPSAGASASASASESASESGSPCAENSPYHTTKTLNNNTLYGRFVKLNKLTTARAWNSLSDAEKTVFREQAAIAKTSSTPMDFARMRSIAMGV
jgi:hypothetical protein